LEEKAQPPALEAIKGDFQEKNRCLQNGEKTLKKGI